MTKMTAFLKTVLIGLLSLAPYAGVWAAPQLNPTGGDENAWSLYVLGNGEAIYYVLTSIKLMLQSPGFHTLILALGTAGVAVVGVLAGFSPAQNVQKFFTFIISTFIVLFVTLKLESTVAIHDRVNNYHQTVTRVPALVAVPASVVSQMGEWMTREIEGTFNLPTELTLTGGSFFNLAHRLEQDLGRIHITNADLKRSLSQYMQDCVVYGIARGDIRLDDIRTQAQDFWKVMEFPNKAVMTTYYPQSSGTSNSLERGLGTVVSCSAAYQFLTEDLQNHAQELLASNSDAWSTTGVMVPLESVATAGYTWLMGDAYGGNPAGFVKQRAMLNTIGGMFREAAARANNNELLLSFSIAQAEHNQKSAWFAAAQLFNNMTGYVFSTLQAFIFAITPLIIIALMIPGFGLAIFKNYFQVLLWLTLWEPMLAIVNFLIALFGKYQITPLAQAASGVSFDNHWAINEAANNMVLAAGFLGTMVPLITWGLVKGSIAFTEFISHGIGNQFASQAGAAAASGNMQLGQISMDNLSMNKFSTASSYAVGNQDVQSYLNAGAMTAFHNFGGTTMSRAGSTGGYSLGYSENEGRNAGLTNRTSAVEGASRVEGGSAGAGHSQGQRVASEASVGDQKNQAQIHGTEASNRQSANETLHVQGAQQVQTTGAATKGAGGDVSASASFGGKSGASGGGSGPGPGGERGSSGLLQSALDFLPKVGAGVKAQEANTLTQSSNVGHSATEGLGADRNVAASENWANSTGRTQSANLTQSGSSYRSNEQTVSGQTSAQATQSADWTRVADTSTTYGQSRSLQWSFHQDVSPADYLRMEEQARLSADVMEQVLTAQYQQRGVLAQYQQAAAQYYRNGVAGDPSVAAHVDALTRQAAGAPLPDMGGANKTRAELTSWTGTAQEERAKITAAADTANREIAKNTSLSGWLRQVMPNLNPMQAPEDSFNIGAAGAAGLTVANAIKAAIGNSGIQLPNTGGKAAPGPKLKK